MKWSYRIATRILEERLFRYLDYYGDPDTALKNIAGWPQTKQDLVKLMKEISQRAFDTTYCNDACKDMYFCDLKKGHKGQHKEDCGLTWDRMVRF